MTEQRVESRFLCADLVRVDWAIGEDEVRSADAVLEDISALGACVQLEERIPVGATISISPASNRESGTGRLFAGHVSYCEYRDYGFFVGVRFSDETTWSSGVFKPEHLTNLAAMSLGGSRRAGESNPGPMPGVT
jgi:hypothetical protein